MPTPCPWTRTDEYGNKHDVRKERIVDDQGRTWQIGPSRGKQDGTISWSKAERLLRRGAKLVRDVDGVGEIMLASHSEEGTLIRDHKVSEYRWGHADVLVRDAAGNWVEPTAKEKDAICDAALVSTISHVKAGATENAAHARSVVVAAVDRIFAGSSYLAGVAGARVTVKDNAVVRGTLVDHILSGRSYLIGPRGIGSVRLYGDGDVKTSAAVIRAATRGLAVKDVHRHTLDKGLHQEAASLVGEHYPDASLPEGVLLAHGLLSEKEYLSRGSRTLESVVSSAMSQREEMLERLEGAKGAAARERGDELRRMLIEGRSPESESDVVKERNRFRDEHMLPNIEYETMPGLAEIVRTAEVRAQEATTLPTPYQRKLSAELKGMLHRAEASHPGAMLWAALYSGVPALQEEAILLLPSPADLEYVMSRSEEGTYAHKAARRVLGRYAEPLQGPRGVEPTERGVKETMHEYSYKAMLDVLEREPHLAASPLMLRGAFDALQDVSILRGYTSPRPEMDLLKDALLDATSPSVPYWLRDADAISVAEDLMEDDFYVVPRVREDGQLMVRGEKRNLPQDPAEQQKALRRIGADAAYRAHRAESVVIGVVNVKNMLNHLPIKDGVLHDADIWQHVADYAEALADADPYDDPVDPVDVIEKSLRNSGAAGSEFISDLSHVIERIALRGDDIRRENIAGPRDGETIKHYIVDMAASEADRLDVVARKFASEQRELIEQRVGYGGARTSRGGRPPAEEEIQQHIREWFGTYGISSRIAYEGHLEAETSDFLSYLRAAHLRIATTRAERQLTGRVAEARAAAATLTDRMRAQEEREEAASARRRAGLPV